MVDDGFQTRHGWGVNTSPDIRQLWDRQKGEPPKQFDAFVKYRDGGPAYSMTKLYEDEYEWDGKPKVRTLERWSSKHNWVARRQAYYDHLDQLRQSRRLSAIAEAEDLLIEKAADIMKAALSAAIDDGDVRAQKDLLDRLGLTRKKVESADRTGINISVEAIQVALQTASLGELVGVLAQLENTTK